MKLGLLLALLSVGGTVADKAQQQQQVADLVANMTLAEKESPGMR